jgi:hypothetical protein
VSAPLSFLARLLLWDFERGSVAYDVLCLVLLAFLFLVSPVWLKDPMVVGP